MKSLMRLLEKEKHAAAELREELERQFPKGTRVAFKIMSGQKNPSTGEVIGYRDNGYLAVRHYQAKKYSRNSVRDVSFGSAQII